MSTKALEHYLLPLRPYLNAEGVTEICINQPQQIFVEQNSQFSSYQVSELTFEYLTALALLIAEYNHKDYPANLISGHLPNGERIQIVMPPACEPDLIIFSIRCHHRHHMTLDDYVDAGAFDEVASADTNLTTNEILQHLYQTKQIDQFLRTAILARKNIIISGGTGTGKTTFLNACLQIISNTERIITVEDTREVKATQPNAVHLLFNEETADMNASNVFKACLRLRPDRIFLSELRGHEAWSFLRAANSGHPGSISTLHADSPEGCFDQLVFMMQQAGSTSSEERIRDYVKSIVPIVVQLKRDSGKRFMCVSEVYFETISVK